MLQNRIPLLATAACAALLLAAPAAFSMSAALALPADRTYYDVQEYAGPTFAGAGTSVSISGDGRYTVFDSVDKLTVDAVGDQKHVYRRSTADGSIQLVSTHSRTDGADGASFGASVSADGRYVVFVTTDRNVLPDDPGGATQVVLKDMDSGAITWVSSRRSTAEADREAVRDASSSSAVISADGQHVAFVSSVPGVNNVGGPTTGVGNVEIYDVATKDVTNVTSGITDAGALVAAHGSSAQPALSADGRFVVFTSDADNLGVAATTPPPTATPGARLSHVYRLDRTTGTTKLVDVSAADTLADLTKTDKNSYLPSVSADGNVVGFISDATNLVPDGDLPKTTHLSDAYLRDMTAGQTHRVSLMLNDVAAPDHAVDGCDAVDHANAVLARGGGWGIPRRRLGRRPQRRAHLDQPPGVDRRRMPQLPEVHRRQRCARRVPGDGRCRRPPRGHAADLGAAQHAGLDDGCPFDAVRSRVVDRRG